MSFSTRQLLPFLGASTFILIPTLASAAPTKPPVKKPASSTARAKSQAARPSVAAPSLTLGNWDYEFEEDELEDRWSWRGQITNGGNGEGRIVFDWKDTKNYNLLQIISAGTTRKLSVWQIQNGIPINKGQINQSSGKEITLAPHSLQKEVNSGSPPQANSRSIAAVCNRQHPLKCATILCVQKAPKIRKSRVSG
jgi:hypothetical protein